MEMEKNKKNRYGFDFTPIGLDIKTFREAQKITREKLAETLDISPRHLQAIELEGKHPSLGLLAYIATIFDMPIDPYIFPEKADAKSAVRKRLDVLLDKLSDRDLSILEATAAALCKAKEQLFVSMAKEVSAAVFEFKHKESRDASEFKSFCVAYMVSSRYGVDTKGFRFDNLPKEFAGMETQEFKGQLDSMRDVLGEIQSDMFKSLEKNKPPKSKEQER